MERICFELVYGQLVEIVWCIESLKAECKHVSFDIYRRWLDAKDNREMTRKGEVALILRLFCFCVCLVDRSVCSTRTTPHGEEPEKAIPYNLHLI